MTPAARVQTAIELLDQILEGTPAEKVLTGWARKSRFAGSKDRAAVRDHVFDVLRRRRSVLAADTVETGRSLMIGLLAQDGADLEDLFSGQGYGPSVLSVEDRAMDEVMQSERALDLPDWVQPLLQASLGDAFLENAKALRKRAPVFLRVNLQKTTREAAIDLLRTDGVETVVCPLADTALEVIEGPRKVPNSQAFKEGYIEVQDASSQAAIAQLPLRDGMRVLDYCAGGGGKTLAMGGRIGGTFVAHDALPQRMSDLPVRADRAGLQVQIFDDNQLTREPGFDLVFCDVPCSGSGTWRRSPDAKWRFSPDDLKALLDVQSEILDNACDRVNSSGTIAYATCSMLREENENQIDRFIARHSDWTCSATHHWQITERCDGFFLALLTRT
ncbi:16S rRNA (cytosine967-C5)-methyltransferase [Shimia gijangensis]|uniref:16S rRNA (Cytosine967-C5)-methyltransferase n=1 Tax=Shimia gijangensis TaxID=1470563 RepID=A0A1M6PPW0_9RHOB|nr:RsmB/NOP family class I SAM-dependent RNA methyltransferase [Shimia gijangensis]SHK09911.1 16S rRNA (cytosine967-C5)-methyltransferase [Shimia gijangensis]